MNFNVRLFATRAWLRRAVAMLILLLWAGSFFIGCGWGWHGLNWQAPKSGHEWITIGLTGGLATLAALLSGLGSAHRRRVVWSVLLLLIAAEALSRMFPPALGNEVTLLPGESAFTARLHQPNHYTLFEPRPNLHTPDGLIHNRFGFRDARPLAPDPTAIRLVFIGGPTVYGAMTRDNRDLFTHHLEELLNANYGSELGGRHFEVVNAGMANATSAETLLRLIFAVSEVKPDLVAIQLGGSDAWPRVASDDSFSDFRQMRKRYSHGQVCQPQLTVADSFARALVYRSALLNRLLGTYLPGEPLLEMTNHNNTGKIQRLKDHPPVYFERNVRYMLSLIRTMGAKALLVGDPIPVGPRADGLYQRAVPEHNAVMSKLGLEEKVPFLNLGTELPLTDDIRIGEKYLNTVGQDRKATLLFVALRDHGIIKELMAKKPWFDHPTHQVQ